MRSLKACREDDRAPQPAVRRNTIPVFLLFSTLLPSLVLWADLPSAALDPPQPELRSIVSGLQKRYADVKTVTARFRQTYRAPGIEQQEEGTLYLKKPGLMHWEYRDPEEKYFITNGREAFLYTPAERQVLIRQFSADALQSTPLQFLLGHGNIMEDFHVSWEEAIRAIVQATHLIRLEPRVPEAGYSYLVLECDAKTFDLRRLVIREQTGNTSEFLLTDLKTGIKISDRKFQFKVPKGVEIIREDVK
jgi:outer membrane lipoprotein carrier protein